VRNPGGSGYKVEAVSNGARCVMEFPRFINTYISIKDWSFTSRQSDSCTSLVYIQNYHNADLRETAHVFDVECGTPTGTVLRGT